MKIHKPKSSDSGFRSAAAISIRAEDPLQRRQKSEEDMVLMLIDEDKQTVCRLLDKMM